MEVGVKAQEEPEKTPGKQPMDTPVTMVPAPPLKAP